LPDGRSIRSTGISSPRCAVAEKIPVSVLTGFLGSGKTTLLSRLLAHPAMGETAVLVNELGEVAIDHHLLRRVDERTVVMASGCVCCTMRSDLSEELRELLSRRTRGELPPFERVLVETTGIADPAPIVYTLLTEPVVKHHFEPEAVVATVDGLYGLRQPESVKQAVVADALVVTKVDVADPAAVRALAARLRGLNPLAPVIEAAFGDVEPGELLVSGRERDPRDLAPEAGHDEGLRGFAVFLDERVDWEAFAVWLTMLLSSHGQDVLRVKGFLDVGGPGPLLLNAVQHVVHPPVHLDAWPDDDRRSRLVFVVRGLEQRAVEDSLAAFNRLGAF
jgi:G3E family GTPase